MNLFFSYTETLSGRLKTDTGLSWVSIPASRIRSTNVLALPSPTGGSGESISMIQLLMDNAYSPDKRCSTVKTLALPFSRVVARMVLVTYSIWAGTSG